MKRAIWLKTVLLKCQVVPPWSVPGQVDATKTESRQIISWIFQKKKFQVFCIFVSSFRRKKNSKWNKVMFIENFSVNISVNQWQLSNEWFCGIQMWYSASVVTLSRCWWRLHRLQLASSTITASMFIVARCVYQTLNQRVPTTCSVYANRCFTLRSTWIRMTLKCIYFNTCFTTWCWCNAANRFWFSYASDVLFPLNRKFIFIYFYMSLHLIRLRESD